jgi:hypothetical protein
MRVLETEEVKKQHEYFVYHEVTITVAGKHVYASSKREAIEMARESLLAIKYPMDSDFYPGTRDGDRFPGAMTGFPKIKAYRP